MSASAIDFHDYVHGLRALVPYEVRSMTEARLEGWFNEMHDAADRNDSATFAKLATWVAETIEQEAVWWEEDFGEAVAPTGIVTPRMGDINGTVRRQTARGRSSNPREARVDQHLAGRAVRAR
jgi:hypothetical protein